MGEEKGLGGRGDLCVGNGLDLVLGDSEGLHSEGEAAGAQMKVGDIIETD